MNAKNEIRAEIVVDAAPFLSFTKLFEGFLQRCERSIDLSNLPLELVRVESDVSAASAGKVLVKFYPSDAFLGFAGAIFAGD